MDAYAKYTNVECHQCHKIFGNGCALVGVWECPDDELAYCATCVEMMRRGCGAARSPGISCPTVVCGREFGTMFLIFVSEREDGVTWECESCGNEILDSEEAVKCQMCHNAYCRKCMTKTAVPPPSPGASHNASPKEAVTREPAWLDY